MSNKSIISRVKFHSDGRRIVKLNGVEYTAFKIGQVPKRLGMTLEEVSNQPPFRPNRPIVSWVLYKGLVCIESSALSGFDLVHTKWK